MSLRFFGKALGIGTLMLVSLVPLAAVLHLLHDRTSYRAHAVNSVVESLAGGQTITGPLLVLPYTDEVLERWTDTDARGRKRLRKRKVLLHKEVAVVPTFMSVDGTLEEGTLRRSIYDILYYEARSTWEARFEVPRPPRPDDLIGRTWGEPTIHVGLSDPRGIRGLPEGSLNGKPLGFEQGFGAEGCDRCTGSIRGIHAVLPWSPVEGATATIRMSLKLAGTGHFRITPLGKQNEVTLSTAWPHIDPGAGSFAPTATAVREGKTEVRWELSALNTQNRLSILEDPSGPSDDEEADTTTEVYVPILFGAVIPDASVGLALEMPDDIYGQVRGALFYGVFCLLITLGALFLLEVAFGTRIHPIQHLFVGFAVSITFLLFLALAEHLGSGPSFAVAATGSTLLATAYLGSVLGRRKAVGFGLMLALLDVVLWAMLRSGENALLLGSVLLLVLLGTAMWLTRRLD